MARLQGDELHIRDYIVPLVAASVDPREPSALRFDEFLGTAFLIGEKGVALTAAHVVKDAVVKDSGKAVVALFTVDGKWRAVPVMEKEAHPDVDVAAVMLAQNEWRPSFFCMNTERERQGCAYMSWGYPEDVLWEQAVNGRALARPDLVYFEGYVRRGVSDVEMPVRWGPKLWELSDPGGRGCSGAPIVKRASGNQWTVIGVYVGERTNSDGIHVGYAVQRDSFVDWSPTIAGRAVIEEAGFARA